MTDADGSTAPCAPLPTALPRLRGSTYPTVVIHGSADRMCHPSGGRATAAAIPGARLEIIDGMGHDLPPGAWPRIIAALTQTPVRPSSPPGGSR